MKKVYIAHPFKNDREKNFGNVTAICRAVAGTRETVIPVSPLHMFSFFNDENPEERKKALIYCLHVIKDCDEVWVFGDWERSEGCRKEVTMARSLGKNLRFFEQVNRIIAEKQ